MMNEKFKNIKVESIFETYAIYKEMVTEFSWRKIKKKNQIDPRRVLKKGKLIIASTGDKQKSVKIKTFSLISDKLIEEEDLSNFSVGRYLYLFFPLLNCFQDKNKFGFSLTSFGKTRIFYCDSKPEYLEWIRAFKLCCLQNNVKEDFIFIEEIGKGSFSKVFLAEKIINKKKYAIKALRKDKLYENLRNMDSVINEISILRRLKHNHIIKFYECYESPNYIFFVMQYLQGGELYQQIKEKKIFNENDAVLIIKELVSTIKYFHEENVIHRDLKPENIILKKKNVLNSFKIVDFGLSVFSKKDEIQTLRCGTPGYAAPELLLKEGYSHKVDIFSLGIISYVLLTGKLPLLGSTIDVTINLNKECKIRFDIEEWNQVSESAKDFVMNLTLKNQLLRFSDEEAENHPWLSKKSIHHINDNISLSTNNKIQSSLNREIKNENALTNNNLKKSNDLNKIGSGFVKEEMCCIMEEIETVQLNNQRKSPVLEIPDEIMNNEEDISRNFNHFKSKFEYHPSGIQNKNNKFSLQNDEPFFENKKISENNLISFTIVDCKTNQIVKEGASRLKFSHKKSKIFNKVKCLKTGIT